MELRPYAGTHTSGDRPWRCDHVQPAVRRWIGLAAGALLLVVLLASCSTADATTDDGSLQLMLSDDTGPLGVVDSILPTPELLERFRAGIARTDTLSHASESIDALVRRFATAVAATDTTDLQAMAMSAAEFAWLYYPDSEFMQPPYELAAELSYMLMDQNSRKGLTRVLRRAGGTEVRYLSHHCPDEPKQRARDRLWEGCTIRLRGADGTEATMRLFGSIWERDGRYKLVSYANEL